MVLRVDPAQRKISLSLKQAAPKETPEATAEEGPEESAPTRPPRPRTTPLRGGIGDE
jgi:ribosomal protein S1